MTGARPDDLIARRFYGRRRGPGLTPRKQRLLETRFPDYAIRLPPTTGERLDLLALFAPRPARIGLEIGFGKGEHLAHVARHCPETGFIGCEPFLNGLAAMTDVLVSEGLANVRLFDDDARLLIDRLPDASVDIVYLLHPDPWPKSRHEKRRFLQDDTLDALARILKDGAELQIVTDHPGYTRWALERMNRRADFAVHEESGGDWRTPPPDWHETRYAHKAGLEGREDAYCRFRRLSR